MKRKNEMRRRHKSRVFRVLAMIVALGWVSFSAYAEQLTLAHENTLRDNALMEYKVQPGDVLQITVYEEPNLSTRVRVSGSGQINFPLLGRISVADISVNNIQDKITEALEKDYLVNPQVLVFIETFHERSVFVSGAVNSPGSFLLPIEQDTTVVEAITLAGGLTEDAAPNKTRIIRIDDNGHELTLNVLVNDIIKKGDKSKDVVVKSNDVIFVPESFF